MEYKKDIKTKSIMLLVATSCNLDCIYCYENHKSKNVMSLKTAKDAILLEASEEGYDLYSIQFMGGEPLLNFPLIKSISEWMWTSNPINKPFELFASTNGTCLNDEMKTWFKRNKDRISLGLSLDGVPFAQNTNRSNSNEKIDFGFFLTTWPDIYIKMTISTHSINYLCDSVIYLEEKGVKNIKADLAFMEGWNTNHLRILEVQLDGLIGYYSSKNRKCHCSLFDMKIDSIFAKDVTSKRCGCGKDVICIDYNGDKYPCQLFAPISMDKELYKTVQYVDFLDDSNFEITECNNCILRSLCPKCCGCNLKYNGSMTKVNSFYCKAFVINFLKYIQYKEQTANQIDDPIIRGNILNDLKEIAKVITIK